MIFTLTFEVDLGLEVFLVMVLDSLTYKCRTNFHSFQVYVSSQKCMNTANHIKKFAFPSPLTFSPGAFG